MERLLDLAAALGTIIALFALHAFLVRRWIRRLGQPEQPSGHKKYIGLEEYRARQMKQRYRDRVS